MSEIRTTKSDGEQTTDTDVNLHRLGNERDARNPEPSSSSVGVYDRPAGSGANHMLLWILLILVIVVLAFMAYQWWF